MSRSNSGAPAPDIPGFYFDPERNRYFRVLPGTNNHNPLTRRMINEKTNLQKIGMEDSRKTCKNIAGKIQHKRITKTKSKNIVSLISQRERGKNYDKTESFCTQLTKAKITSCGEKITHFVSRYPCIDCIIPSLDYDEVLQTVTQTNGWDEVAIFSKENLKVHNIKPGNCGCIFDSIAYANNVKEKGFYTNVSYQVVGCFASPVRADTDCKKTPFTCAAALNPRTKYVASFGNDKRAVFVSNFEAFSSQHSLHPRGGPGYTSVRLHGDVLAQSFSHSPDVHYNGLRGGEIVGLDMRVLKNKHFSCSMKIQPKINVNQLLPLTNEFGLIAGYKCLGEIPKIYLWDTRFPTRYVLQYKSDCTVNRCVAEHINLRFTMSADKDDRILTSVLPDLKARLWSINTGEIVKKYPDDHRKLVTAAAYTNDWSMFDGKSGILTAVYKGGYEFLDFAG